MTWSENPYRNPTNTNVSRLFKPLQIGNLTLKHRIVLAPLTRARSPAGIPSQLNVEYYEQRATDGGLLITEGTHISSGNYHNVPGIYTPEQIRAWRVVTSAVHAKGGFIFVQLWHVGRNTVKENMGGRQAVSSSPYKLEGGANAFNPTGGPIPYEDPREMSEKDMRETLEDYKHASRAAVEAGFDGVMIHGANGYLIDQFLHDNINKRTDSYGGSIPNRVRFPFQIIEACISAIGASRVALRLSPFGSYQGTRDSDPVATYTYLLSQLRFLPALSFIEVLEPSANPDNALPARRTHFANAAFRRGVTDPAAAAAEVSLRPFRRALEGTGVPLLSGGLWGGEGTEYARVGAHSDDAVDAVTVGRYFISNPDFVGRVLRGRKLVGYDHGTFYKGGEKGYTDYLTWEQQQQQQEEEEEEEEEEKRRRSKTEEE